MPSLFLLPFIIFYEIGTILINTDVLNQYQVRVVAFVWVQDVLLHLGTGSRFAWIAPPVVVVMILIGLQIASKKPWYFCLSDYTPDGAGMCASGRAADRPEPALQQPERAGPIISRGPRACSRRPR